MGVIAKITTIIGQVYGYSRKKRGRTLFSFYKPSESTPAPASEVQTPSNVNIGENSSAVKITDNQCEQPIFKSQRIEIDLNTLERDPGIRKPIWQYDVNQRDAIRRAYIKMGISTLLLLVAVAATLLCCFFAIAGLY
ncbi:hypothetical protein POM88_014971 [Heracleum sosnowskyi]|uniref:Uncharacterized protein n=1 Tax=Heracleum sosnowskyi TaxID=360622 RepID=A0AAD8MX00_9APIA|nr:hypothetical protein POM88_014971 [Heracleum sosnowskyi]